MSVLVKGMEMPKDCAECKLKYLQCRNYCFNHKCVDLYVFCRTKTPRPDWCPLVEVPTPHGRLIDENDICKVCEPMLDNTDKCLHMSQNDIAKFCLTAGTTAPTIIEAED